jgi:hypothetical protein
MKKLNENSFFEWMFMYMDNELTDSQKKSFENFLSSSDKALEEFEKYSTIKLIPSHGLIDTNKYQKEQFQGVLSDIEADKLSMYRSDDELGVFEKVLLNDYENNKGKLTDYSGYKLSNNISLTIDKKPLLKTSKYNTQSILFRSIVLIAASLLLLWFFDFNESLPVNRIYSYHELNLNPNNPDLINTIEVDLLEDKEEVKVKNVIAFSKKNLPSVVDKIEISSTFDLFAFDFRLAESVEVENPPKSIDLASIINSEENREKLEKPKWFNNLLDKPFVQDLKEGKISFKRKRDR